MQLEHVVNFATHPISDPQYEQACKQQLDQEGTSFMYGHSLGHTSSPLTMAHLSRCHIDYR